MNRRAQIAMSEQEVGQLLADQRTLLCVTIGPRGWPHAMPLWYVLRPAPEGTGLAHVWAWTYAASQKARNLQRDPRATLELHDGGAYEELRGAMIEATVTIHRDAALVAQLGRDVLRRCGGGPGAPPRELPAADLAMVERQAPKRVALEFVARRVASFDHRKVAGG